MVKVRQPGAEPRKVRMEHRRRRRHKTICRQKLPFTIGREAAFGFRYHRLCSRYDAGRSSVSGQAQRLADDLRDVHARYDALEAKYEALQVPLKQIERPTADDSPAPDS